MELERYSLTYFRSDICVTPYGTINDFRYLSRPYAGVGYIKKRSCSTDRIPERDRHRNARHTAR